ncbi:hypothetical protein [Nocardia sp. NPDC019302]|uniref:hypothetical protein n=1 Tax=Nocardia sp. NPDC019302 TaxID=3154592 RepID=UPI0033FD8EBC
MFSAGETVTVIRPGTRDRVGDPAGGSPHTIDNCAIVQTESENADSSRFSVSDGDRRTATVTRMELLCPPGADIRAGDKVRLAGDDTLYEVDGIPWTPRNPFTSWTPGTRVRLRGVS